jgi:hypothetical protein
MSDLYEEDIVLWSEEQARALRAAALSGANLPIDWENVAEEIEALGRSERSTLASHINTIIEHLARLDASPATDPRKGWIETILRTRDNIENVLESSPRLKRSVEEIIAAEHPRALRLVNRVLAVYGETPRVPLDGLHYEVEQVLGPWLPADEP